MIDTAALKGRLIMPQAEAIRETIDHAATTIVTKDTELVQTLEKLDFKVDLVVNDSQAIMEVEKIVGYSCNDLLDPRKGQQGRCESVFDAIEALKNLKDSDTVAVVEAYSHVPTCDDTVRVKIPRWISEKLKVQPDYRFLAGK